MHRRGPRYASGMDRPTLIYLPARGRAELIRLILAEAELEYDELTVQPGFPGLKGTGRLPFDAVPVWEEPDGFRLAQSAAIASHIAGGHGLRGKTARDAALCEQMLGAYEDVRAEGRRLAQLEPARRPALRKELAEATFPRWAGYFDRWLGDRPHLVGDQLTLADLALWYLVEMLADNGLGAAIERYPRLGAFAERIGDRPRLRAWVSSPRRFPVVRWPS